jgi:dipeptidyl aminopeptidase/acylaminoacyl peptidase
MKRPFTIEDLLSIRVPGDIQLSPDASTLAFTVTAIDKERDAYTSAIWIAPVMGPARPHTAGASTDSCPRWSPDGRTLAFISTRDAPAGVWLIARDGGEARRLATLPGEPVELAWSPRGDRLAVAVNEPPRDAPSDVKRITRLRYKLDGAGFTFDHHRHIWFVNAVSGHARRLTNGEWDDTAPAWSPDGRHVAFLSNRTADPDRNNVMDIWVVAADDPAALRKLTPSLGPCLVPAWSPDGTRIAYVGNTDPPETGVSTNHHLWIVSVSEGEPRDVMASMDVCLGSLPLTDMGRSSPVPPIQWSQDGGLVWAVGTDRGRASLLAVNSNTGACRVAVGGDRHILSAAVSPDGSVLAYLSSDDTTPGEAYTQLTSGPEQRVSSLNDVLLDERIASSPEAFAVSSSDGTMVHGWVLKPPEFDPSARYPAILEIHGGPYYVLFGHTFFHELQVLAGLGYVVAYANPRGSQGYGQAFASANRGDWGGVDYHDLMAVADWLASRAYVDPERIGVTGGSYGGFMTNWIVTQTNRFAAAVAHRSVSNHQSFYGTSDVAYGPMNWIFGGPPWEQPDLYRERSPITHVQNVTTPLLLIHAERDLRCAIEQAEQFYTALKRLGREVALVRIPDEDHNMTRNGKPSHRIESLWSLVRWFDEHLRPAVRVETAAAQEAVR